MHSSMVNIFVPVMGSPRKIREVVTTMKNCIALSTHPVVPSGRKCTLAYWNTFTALPRRQYSAIK